MRKSQIFAKSPPLICPNFDRSVFLILKPIWNLCGIFMAWFLSRNYWSLLNHDLKASIWEKANPIFAGNYNSSLSYLNNHTAVVIQVLRHTNCILNLVKLGKALCWRHMFICIMLNHSLQRKYLLQLSEKCKLYFLVTRSHMQFRSEFWSKSFTNIYRYTLEM